MILANILLQTDVTPDPGVLFEGAKNVANGGGYTFAVTVLIFVMLTLLLVIRSLWNTLKEKEDKYSNLAQSTTTMLTEVNMKLDGQEEIKTKIEKIIEILQTKLVNSNHI